MSHDRVITAQIRKVAARLDRRLGEAEVEEVGNGGEGCIVPFHEFGSSLPAGCVQRDSFDFPIAPQAIDACGYFPCTFHVGIGQGHSLDLSLPGHVVSCRRAHHPGTNHQQFHECTSHSWEELIRPN